MGAANTALCALCVPPDSVPQIPLLSAPSARCDHRHTGPHFAVLPLGLENLLAVLVRAIATVAHHPWEILSFKDKVYGHERLFRPNLLTCRKIKDCANILWAKSTSTLKQSISIRP